MNESESPTGSGDAAIDAILRRLDALATTPVDGHVPIFDQVHRELRDALVAVADDDSSQAPAGTRAARDD